MACACDAGFGAAEPPRFPNVERVLARYIRDELRAGRSFWISPELNSDVLRGMDPDALDKMWPGGLGFLPALAAVFSAVVGAASTVGSAVVAAAPSIASIAGSAAAIKTADAANKQLAQRNTGIAIPQSAAAPIVNAVQNDVLGNTGLTPSMLAMLAVGGIGLILLARR